MERLGKERNGMGISWKERLKSLTRSYFQEGLPSWERILSQECVSAVQIFSVCSEPKLKDGTIVNDIRHNNIGK